MTFNDNIKTELSCYVYKLENVTYFDSQKSIMQTPSHHSLILFKESIGQIELNGTNYSINEDSVFFSHANNHKKQEIHFTERLQGYHFQFYSLINQVAGEYKQSPLSCPQKLYTTQHSLLQTKAEEIFNLQDHDKMMANILFQKWIYTVFNELQTGQSLSIEQLIHKSREYINTHYHLEITRDQLAQMTGLNVDYYSRKFKQYFQKSPITYLNDVRLWQAKQRLIQTNEPIRSIAKQVGFTDEFYFSRKFKTKEGYSPTFYINKLKQSRRLASLNHVVTGHSLALGIEPYAAIRNQSFPLTSEIEHTLSIGNEYPDLERLLTVKPELIVRCAPADQKQTKKDELYHHIAPTVTLSFQDSWKKNLDIMARLLNRENEAMTFLETYHTKVEMVKKQIKHKVGSGNILILGIGEGAICVYGQRNLGSVLYNDLHISKPEGVEQIYHVKEISLSDLCMMNPDHILLTIYRNKNRLPSKQAIRNQIVHVQQSPEWNALKAVQQDKIYSILDTNHLYTSYNSLSQHLFLNKMQQLLTERI